MPDPSYLLLSAGGRVLGWQVAPLPLGAPSALSVSTTRVRPTDLTLAWVPTDGGQATSYAVERAPDVSGSPGAWAQVGTAARPATTFTDPALACYTPYWYRVKGVNRHGESGYSPAARCFTSGILRTLFNVAGINLGTNSGAGDFTRPMTPTAQLLRDAGINTLTSGFMGSAIAQNPSFAAWQVNFDGAGGFPRLRDTIIHADARGFYWLPVGDDLVRTQGALDASTGTYGPQAVAYAVQALAAATLPSGEFAVQCVEMCDEANGVIPPARQPPQAKVYAVAANVRASAPRLQLGWPCDGGTNSTGEAAILALLRPWQTPPLADYGDVYSAASAWFVADDDGGTGYTVARGLAAQVNQAAYVADIPAAWVSDLVPCGGDFGNVNADGSKTVVSSGWKPGVTLGSIWVELALGITTLRYYSWDDQASWNTRNPGTPGRQYTTGMTAQVQPANWACMSASNNLIARLESRICGTPGAAPAWGANFVTAQRTAADGSKILWGVNATNSPQTVPAAPAGYANATKITADGGTTDMAPSALAGSTLQPGEPALFWN
jgi:hypothetical protein